MTGHELTGHEMTGYELKGHELNGQKLNGHELNGHKLALPLETRPDLNQHDKIQPALDRNNKP